MEKYLSVWLIFINAISFIVFGVDKKRAVKGKFRIRESTLFALSLLGGSLGSLAAMYAFHHKTKKWYFKFGIPLILLTELAAVLHLLNLLPIF